MKQTERQKFATAVRKVERQIAAMARDEVAWEPVRRAIDSLYTRANGPELRGDEAINAELSRLHHAYVEAGEAGRKARQARIEADGERILAEIRESRRSESPYDREMRAMRLAKW